jgi:hypothetical protein
MPYSSSAQNTNCLQGAIVSWLISLKVENLKALVLLIANPSYKVKEPELKVARGRDDGGKRIRPGVDSRSTSSEGWVEILTASCGVGEIDCSTQIHIRLSRPVTAPS